MAPGHDEIRSVAERIAGSRTAALSPRLQRLLIFLVEEELAGRGDHLKAYVIGTEALGRPESFDPDSDSIVRAEMGRLRRALALYNAYEGRDDPVRILLNPGSYRPIIELNAAIAAPTPAPPLALSSLPRGKARRWRGMAKVAALVFIAFAAGAVAQFLGHSYNNLMPVTDPGHTASLAARPDIESASVRPTLVIYPLSAATSAPADLARARALTAALTESFSQNSWLQIRTGEAQPETEAANDSPRAFRTRLDGLVLQEEDLIAVTILLRPDDSNTVEWSKRYEERATGSGSMTAIRNLAEKIAAEVARPYGVLTSLNTKRAQSNQILLGTPTGCLMQAFAYWQMVTPALRGRVQSCLEKAVGEAPKSPDVLAALAIILWEEINFRPLSTQEHAELRRRTQELVETARLYGQFRSIVELAAVITGQHDGDREGFQRAIDTVLAAEPHNPMAHSVYVLTLGRVFGEWDLAIAHFDQTLAPSRRLPERIWLLPMEQAMVTGKMDKARQIAERFPRNRFPPFVLARLALAGHLGDADFARRELALLSELGMPDRATILAFAGSVRLSPEGRASMIEGAKLAFAALTRAN
jgi:TolB-like protein